MGKGIGAAIATQAALFDGRCDVLILESPILNLSTLSRQICLSQMEFSESFWYPVFRRKVESLMEFPIRILTLETLKYIKTPTLFVAVPDNELVSQQKSFLFMKILLLPEKNYFVESGWQGWYSRGWSLLQPNFRIHQRSYSKKIKKTKYKNWLSMISKDTIDRIFNTARIEEVVGDFVPQKKRCEPAPDFALFTMKKLQASM